MVTTTKGEKSCILDECVSNFVKGLALISELDVVGSRRKCNKPDGLCWCGTLRWHQSTNGKTISSTERAHTFFLQDRKDVVGIRFISKMFLEPH
jgi:hypothetical protein